MNTMCITITEHCCLCGSTSAGVIFSKRCIGFECHSYHKVDFRSPYISYCNERIQHLARTGQVAVAEAAHSASITTFSGTINSLRELQHLSTHSALNMPWTEHDINSFLTCVIDQQKHRLELHFNVRYRQNHGSVDGKQQTCFTVQDNNTTGLMNADAGFNNNGFDFDINILTQPQPSVPNKKIEATMLINDVVDGNIALERHSLGSIPTTTTTFASPTVAKEPASASSPFGGSGSIATGSSCYSQTAFGNPSSQHAAALGEVSVAISSP